MLDWLMSMTRSADGEVMNNGMCRTWFIVFACLTCQGDYESFLEDPPETPAPLFAVRAFKSALFGTPHPAQPASPSNRLRKAVAQNSVPKAAAPPQETLKTIHVEPQGREDVSQKLDFEALVSPTKGILLTPGIGSTRRKNVTFRGIGSDERSKARNGSKDSLFGDNTPEASSSQSQASSHLENRSRQTSLTKTLYRAKNGISAGRMISPLGVSRSEKQVSSDWKKDRRVGFTETEGNDLDVADDLTIDLSNPLSRSGQHWKAEFERYHKNSNREMKEVLRANQKVKSFAVEKDSEASDLSEKLQRELSKVAAMEKRVTDLATQLAATRKQDHKETPDQTKLVNELARQTTLAIRYKQKADSYKVALMKRNVSLPSEVDGVEEVVPQGTRVNSNQGISDSNVNGHLSQDMASLRSELDKFRSSAAATEQKAAKLETENLALQAEIDSLRQGMKIFESKRQARDQILPRQEEILKASNADRSAQSPTSSTINQALLQDGQRHGKASSTPERKTSKDHGEISSRTISQDKVPIGKLIGGQDHSKPRKNPNAHDPESSIADIWILGGQDNTPPPEKPRKNKVSVKHSPKVLKEITQNRILEEENRKPHRKTRKSENPPSHSKFQPAAHESPHSTISFSSRKRLPTSSGTKPKSLARPSTANNSSPRPSTLNPASNPPKTKVIPSTQHPTHQHVTKSDHQQKSSKSPIDDDPSTPPKATSNQGATITWTETDTDTDTEEGRKQQSKPEIPIPAPAEAPTPAPVFDRRAAMRARREERMAENRKRVREGRGVEA